MSALLVPRREDLLAEVDAADRTVALNLKFPGDPPIILVGEIQRVWHLIDGVRTVADIADMAGAPSINAAADFVAALVDARLVSYED